MKIVATKGPTADGYQDPKRPGKPIPFMPLEVGDIPDDELMLEFNTFTAWAEYLTVETAKALAIEEALEDRLEEAKQLAVLEGAGGLWKARARGFIENRELRLRFLSARNVRKLLEAKAANCVRNAGALSRELTRRTQIAEGQRGRRYGA